MDSEERDERRRKGFNERGETLFNSLNQGKNIYDRKVPSSGKSGKEEQFSSEPDFEDDDDQISIHIPF